MSPSHSNLEGLAQPGGCEQHPTAGRIGSNCLSCVIIPAPSGVEVGTSTAGPSWYEVINPRNATTCIAYVHEDGTLYLPEGEDTLTHEEFTFAAVQGKAHRLFRADDVEDVRAPGPAGTAVERVRALYDQWVKAGAPPLGTSISRWWDARLAEMLAALLPSDQLRHEQGAPVDWQAIAEQRERELKKVGEARRRAEMAIARVRLIKKAPGRSPFNLAANAQDDGWDQALDAVHAALGAPERCETGDARKGHPVHELLAALEAGVPHPDPRDLIGRYYQAIHELCCPYDHTEPRPGHAAAANRAVLDHPKEH